MHKDYSQKSGRKQNIDKGFKGDNMKFDGIIFDMDGVIVDVSRSYREAIRLTAGYFLGREIMLQEVSDIKSKMGFNNDWDASYALINDKSISYKKVKAYFQAIYLGNGQKKGLINNEYLLISKTQLLSIKDKYEKIGIASGRPKEEANYVIKNNKLKGVFDFIVTLDDVKKDKPSPESIIKVKEKLELKNTVYIGDSSNDVLAASAAGIPSIYIGEQNIGTYRFLSTLKAVEYLL
jgi:HAD superfamily hydrolase (TIGR01548 family)